MGPHGERGHHGEPRSGRAAGAARRGGAADTRSSGARLRPAGLDLQPRPRHPPADAGRQRRGARRDGARLERLMTAGGFDSVLLLAFGGPTRPEEIRPFLDNVLRGRQVPQERYEQVVQHYIEVGGASPIARLTEAQAEGLREQLRREGPALPVFVGMRHWHPFVNETLGTMAGRALKRAVGIVLAAHPSLASREAYFRAVAEAQRRVGTQAPAVEFVDPWYEHPLLIESLAARLRAAMEQMPKDRREQAALLFTAHSIPAAMSQESGYEAAIRRTADLVAEAAGAGAWRL